MKRVRFLMWLRPWTVRRFRMRDVIAIACCVLARDVTRTESEWIPGTVTSPRLFRVGTWLLRESSVTP